MFGLLVELSRCRRYSTSVEIWNEPMLELLLERVPAAFGRVHFGELKKLNIEIVTTDARDRIG